MKKKTILEMLAGPIDKADVAERMALLEQCRALIVLQGKGALVTAKQVDFLVSRGWRPSPIGLTAPYGGSTARKLYRVDSALEVEGRAILGILV